MTTFAFSSVVLSLFYMCSQLAICVVLSPDSITATRVVINQFYCQQFSYWIWQHKLKFSEEGSRHKNSSRLIKNLSMAMNTKIWELPSDQMFAYFFRKVGFCAKKKSGNCVACPPSLSATVLVQIPELEFGFDLVCCCCYTLTAQCVSALGHISEQ